MANCKQFAKCVHGDVVMQDMINYFLYKWIIVRDTHTCKVDTVNVDEEVIHNWLII